MPLKPYFHGTTSRSGAPFWFGSVLPYRPDGEQRQRVHRLVHAQRLRRTASRSTRALLARHLLGIEQRRERDVLRVATVGSRRLISSPSGKPSHGITIDHASTQRMR